MRWPSRSSGLGRSSCRSVRRVPPSASCNVTVTRVLPAGIALLLLASACSCLTCCAASQRRKVVVPEREAGAAVRILQRHCDARAAGWHRVAAARLGLFVLDVLRGLLVGETPGE